MKEDIKENLKTIAEVEKENDMYNEKITKAENLITNLNTSQKFKHNKSNE